MIRKEALGAGAADRIGHEREILRRLAGVPGVVQLAEGADGVPMDRRFAGDSAVLLLQDVGGSSLRERIRAGWVDLAQLPRLALAMANTFIGLHRAGVIHRDVNPANMLLDAAGQAVLIDFDLASTFAEVHAEFTNHGEIVGQLPYLAPEQLGRTALPVDSRADLYGLGAIMYELAAGRPPFGDGEDLLQLVRDIVATRPQPLTVAVPTLSPLLSDIVARLLEKDPGQRYQSAEGLAHDLRLACESPHARVVLGERDFPIRLVPPSAVIGRDTEIAVLRDTFDAVLASPETGPGAASAPTGRTVLVAGAPGVGKSSLIGQLRPLVAARQGLFVSAKFDQFRGDAGGRGLVQALSALGRRLLADPDEVLAVTRERIGQLGADAGLLAAVVEEFATLLAGIDVPHGPEVTQRPLRQAALGVLKQVVGAQRPMVLVLDDLQWADRETLRFIDTAQADPQLCGLLVVGTYRDTELDETSPLSVMMTRWERRGSPPVRLALLELDAESQSLLLAEMMRLPAHRAATLAAAVSERTGGNPYDTVELINALRRDGALWLGDLGWEWDDTAIRRHIGKGDVVDLLNERLARLPEATRELLALTASLGSEARLDLVAVASGNSVASSRKTLEPALEDGLLVFTDDQGGPLVRFRHDRVQQAARTATPEHQQLHMHRDAARRLSVDPRFQRESADQYLAFADNDWATLDRPGELGTVARLFESAAVNASHVSDHAGAQRYLRAAIQLIGEAPAADDAVMIRLEVAHHGALYNLGLLDQADEVYESLDRRCTDPMDLAPATVNQVLSLVSRGRTQEAISLGIHMLSRLGLAVPSREDMKADVARRQQRIYGWLDEVRVADDVSRPESTAPLALAAGRLIGRISVPAFFTDELLMNWLATTALELWIEHGPNAAIVAPIAKLQPAGFPETDDYATSVRIMRHVLAVSEARGYEPATSDARFQYAARGSHWFEPIEEGHEHVRLAWEGLVAAGDLQTAGFALLSSLFTLIDCDSLDVVSNESDRSQAFFGRTANDTGFGRGLVIGEFVRSLSRGSTDKNPMLDPDALLGRLRTDRLGLAYLHVYRALAAAILGEQESLLDNAVIGMEMMRQFSRVYQAVHMRLAHLMAQANLARTGPMDRRPAALIQVEQCRDWFARRAADAPENFGHLARFAQAQRAWAEDDFKNAAEAFDTALREAELRPRTLQRALMLEQAGSFYLEYGIERVGQYLLTEACDQYAAWGGRVKVARMQERYPFLRRAQSVMAGLSGSSRGSHASRKGTSAATAGTIIDMMGIMRVSQALSSETNLDRLQAAVVEHVRAITGATHVSLLLVDETEGWVLPGGDEATPPLTLSQAATDARIPLTAFRYAERTAQPLVVADALRDDRFSRDPYFAGVERCSLLLVPIARKGGTEAMLVLENRLASGTFTADRLDAVMLIAGQLSVSIGNAMLYRKLEDRVKERTAALAAANRQLEGLSLTDPLTGLGNRRRFDETLAAAWKHGQLTGTPVGVVMTDVDHFKQYNDHYGHPGGDACLNLVADALRTAVRGTDLVCRYGGEEFAVIVPGADATVIAEVAERTRVAVEQSGQPHVGNSWGVVTVSAGAASRVPSASDTEAVLVTLADQALYDAKRDGRNRVAVST